ncbi:MAG: hypothetical protein WC708_12155 [Lentisphaeria bacterium]
MKRRIIIVLGGLVLILVLVMSVIIWQHLPDRNAQAEGFERMNSVEATGTDGHRYKVDFFWERLRSVPGEHRIMARIWLSKTNHIDQWFTSGNRLELKSIKIRRGTSSDTIVFRYKTYYGPDTITENTVAADGIHGDPEAIAAWRKSRKVKTTKPLIGGDGKPAPLP